MYDVGALAKVIKINKDNEFILVRYLNGNTNWLYIYSIEEIEIDDILFLTNTSFTKVEKDLWVEPLKFGSIIKVDNDNASIIFNNSLHKLINPSNLKLDIGDTVSFTFENGIEALINSKQSLVEDTNDFNIDSYIYDANTITDTFEDYGGNTEVVLRAKELINISLSKKFFLDAIGTKPIKGVLFTGPPGSGKTMLARIIAKQVEATFYHINGPEIFTKYFGDSEKLLRTIFKDAQTKEKAIIFFDEIDSVASKRQDDSHELSKRVVTQLLTLMDGFDKNSNTLVIATTNRPDDIDPALRRPGRFDWEIEFYSPRTLEERKHILLASGRNISKAENLPYERIATKMDDWSASEITAIWNEAGLLAAKDNRKKIYTEDFLEAHRRISIRK